jgi:MFS family permease
MVSTYANKILQESFNLDPSLSHLIAAMGGVEYAICSLLSVLLIEGLGRRKAFMFTAAGMSACFAVIAGLLSTTERANKLAAAGLLFLFNTFFGLAWVGGPFLYSAEIAPLRCRSEVNAIASAGNWLFCFVVVMIIPPAFANIGSKTVSLCHPSLLLMRERTNNKAVHHLRHLQCPFRDHHLLLPRRDKEALIGRARRRLRSRR